MRYFRHWCTLLRAGQSITISRGITMAQAHERGCFALAKAYFGAWNRCVLERKAVRAHQRRAVGNIFVVVRCVDLRRLVCAFRRWYGFLTVLQADQHKKHILQTQRYLIAQHLRHFASRRAQITIRLFLTAWRDFAKESVLCETQMHRARGKFVIKHARLFFTSWRDEVYRARAARIAGTQGIRFLNRAILSRNR